MGWCGIGVCGGVVNKGGAGNGESGEGDALGETGYCPALGRDGKDEMGGNEIGEIVCV
jgi:hypothetical protein